MHTSKCDLPSAFARFLTLLAGYSKEGSESDAHVWAVKLSFLSVYDY